eukprot:m.213707 g.213707  ORF g.213707 m.213707 type:complete len:55 (+) comp15578_c2_seq30:138-302(+)
MVCTSLGLNGLGDVLTLFLLLIIKHLPLPSVITADLLMQESPSLVIFVFIHVCL